MHKGKLIAGVILVFAVGVLAGSLGTRTYVTHRLRAFGPGGPPPHQRKALVTERLARELNLTESQRADIGKIVEESEAKMLAVRRKYLPEIKQITDTGLALMREKLTPDQRVKLEALHRKLEDRHARAFIRSIETGESAEQVLSALKQRLILTDDQLTGVVTIIEDDIAERRRIVEKYESQEHPDPSLLRDEVRALDRSIEKRLSEILTREQMETYRSLQDEKRRELRWKTRRHGMPKPE
jgi:hypothetical protein